jgi:ribose transport system substrate-binding protein
MGDGMESRNVYLENAVRQLPILKGTTPQKIGYVVNYSFHVWYQVVTDIIRLRARQYGIKEVLIKDAEQDLSTELRVVDELIAAKVDALIVTPVAAAGTEAIVQKAGDAGIPLVLEANPIPGMTTMIAICDYDAGVKAGRWAGEYALKKFGGKAKLLDIAYPPLRPCLLRSEGFLDGLRSVIPDAELVSRVNGLVQIDTAEKAAREALGKHFGINIIFGMDDESTHGGLNAVRALGMNEDDIVMIGFGLAGEHDKDKLFEPGPWKASVAMFPEWVGLMCVDQMIKVINGESVPQHEVTPTVTVTRESITGYYEKKDGQWIPRFEAIASVRREETCTRV